MGAPRPRGDERRVEFVDDPDRLPAALSDVRGPVIGVDVERADSHRYFRRAALIQMGDAHTCVLVDSLALDDLAPVDAALEGRLAVFHAIENDIEPLDAVGVQPERVADTAVAAAMLGLPTGLGPLLHEVLDVALTPDKERFQRADWEERPLTPEMAAYAAGDVFHLPELWGSLEQRLESTSRRAWYDQELEATLEAAREDRRDWTRTKGVGRLSPHQRAVLRHLWEAREAIAREHDIAPGRLLRDETLLDLAVRPAEGPRDLLRRNQRRRGPLKDHAEELFRAQERGRAAEPEERNTTNGGQRWDQADKAAYDAMRKARAELAKELGIDAGVLCPSRPLWAAVLAHPQDPAELCAAAGLRPWQAELLADVLWEAYAAEVATT